MKIGITKLTEKSLLDRACSITASKDVIPNLKRLYLSEHSPIRTQLFWIEMQDIPTFVSVHFVRHKIGVEHFVKSNRSDATGYSGDLGRMQPVNHAMLVNAQALINMSRKRLCRKASPETREIMGTIVHVMSEVDKALAECMVPECEYRGKCHEIKECKGK